MEGVDEGNGFNINTFFAALLASRAGSYPIERLLNLTPTFLRIFPLSVWQEANVSIWFETRMPTINFRAHEAAVPDCPKKLTFHWTSGALQALVLLVNRGPVRRPQP